MACLLAATKKDIYMYICTLMLEFEKAFYIVNATAAAVTQATTPNAYCLVVMSALFTVIVDIFSAFQLIVAFGWPRHYFDKCRRGWARNKQTFCNYKLKTLASRWMGERLKMVAINEWYHTDRRIVSFLLVLARNTFLKHKALTECEAFIDFL